MTVPATVHAFLQKKGGQYRARNASPDVSVAVSAAAAGLDPSRVAVASLFDAQGVPVMVVHALSQRPSPEALRQLFKRQVTLVVAPASALLFRDCDAGWIPPLGEAYGLKAVVDPAVAGEEDIYFPSGRAGLFIRAGSKAFANLVSAAWRRKVTDSSDTEPTGEPLWGKDARVRVEGLRRLPPMPVIATEILRLRNNPYTHVSELAAVVEQDPSLTAQVIRYASSPFFGYQGKVESVAMAISRVLGSDFVMDLSFGLALGRCFRNPAAGPLGLDAFWRHATYSASLTQALCTQIEYLRRPSAGTAYLAGLLHNFGLLLLGHLFPEQFQALNRAVAEAPKRPMTAIERDVLGIGHGELGVWLAEAWALPQEIREVIREHHNPACKGDFAVYVQLVCIANRLLKRHGIGDAPSAEVPEGLLRAVGLNLESAEAALLRVLESRDSLDFMAQKMAA